MDMVAFLVKCLDSSNVRQKCPMAIALNRCCNVVLLCLSSSWQVLAVDGALSAVLQLCEDSSDKLSSDASLRPLEEIMPRLIALVKHAEPSFRLRALTALNSLLFLLPMGMDAGGGGGGFSNGGFTACPITPYMPTYLEGLASLSTDPNGAGVVGDFMSATPHCM